MICFRPHPGFLAASLLIGCQADDVPVGDGSPPPADVSGDTNAQRAECARAIDRATTECPPPLTLSIIDFDDDPDRPPLELIDLESASTSFPGGLYVSFDPSLPAEAALGHVLADNDVCQISCTIPCDVSHSDFCASSRTEAPSCSFCGPAATLAQCEAFVAACG